MKKQKAVLSEKRTKRRNEVYYGSVKMREAVEAGKTILGIVFGSTRIKAVLTNEENAPIAQGAHDWENRLENGIWTYTLEDIWTGLQDAYAKLAADVKSQCGASLKKIGAIGFSAMMHGYMYLIRKEH